MGVTIPAGVLRRYARVSRFDSPYPAHDRGHAIDLYPDDGAPSPVAGTVLDVRSVRAPTRAGPGLARRDHLVLVDVGDAIARLLHVDPAVRPGDRVEAGERLGRPVRSGYFDPWVGHHVHLELRPPDRDPVRASGSVPIGLGTRPLPVAWDGVGRVREAGPDWVRLDAPAHPAPEGGRLAGIAVDGGGAILDGGLPHYPAGGVVPALDGPVGLLGTTVGRARDGVVEWEDVRILANGEPIVGLSLHVARGDDLGAMLVRPDHDFGIGEEIRVHIERRAGSDPAEEDADGSRDPGG